MKIDAKTKFNALANATHIFALKEEKTKFKLLEVVVNPDNCKAVVELEDKSIIGVFTDSVSARDAFLEVKNVFGDECPLMTINMRETKKGASVYYVELV